MWFTRLNANTAWTRGGKKKNVRKMYLRVILLRRLRTVMSTQLTRLVSNEYPVDQIGRAE